MKNVFLLRSVIIVLSIAIFTQIIHAQTNWTLKNQSNSGLINNQVSKIYQDQKGNIWIGTIKGLNIVHGENWDTYKKSNGMSHKRITDINEDLSGNIWVSTLNGITLFKGKDISYLNKKDGLANKRIYSVETDSKGNVWLGTRKGVSVYDGQNWKSYNMKNGLINNLVIDIMEDMNGDMWFATPKGVSLFDGMNWKSYNKKDGLARNMAMSMDEESNGKIWFGSLNGAFSSRTDSTWEYVKKGSGYYNYYVPISYLFGGIALSLGTGIPGLGGIMFLLGIPLGALPSQATFVYIDSKDKVWLASQPKGVFMFDGQNWMQYTTGNGLPHKRVNALLETSDGDMWFGTAKGIAIMNK